jgi:hypothetical protein
MVRMIIEFLLLHHHSSHDIKYMCFNLWRKLIKIIETPLEDILMNKILSLIAMALMIVGLSGCLDDPDKSAQKVSSSIQL